MIRITNSMMNANTKSNINLNKTTADKLNTMTATGQKITKPSDDPVIAIRALRLNSSIAQLNQYSEKNIPDAEAWMTITETALSQTDTIFTSIKGNLTQGASDDNTESDRMKILESLKALRDQVYASGNADYADRTVFTGYRTGEPLTVLSTDDLTKIGYKQIVEPVKAEDIEKMTYIKGTDSPTVENDVQSVEINRIRLAYDKLDDTDVTIKYTDKNGVSQSVTLTPKSPFTDADYTGAASAINAETGELIIGDNLKDLFDATDISITYAKSSFRAGDLRPEHYFACVDKDGIEYNWPKFEEQEIRYEVSFNQTITINTHASDVYPHGIGRDIDDLLKITQAALDAQKELNKLKKDSTVDKESQEYLAAKKAYDMLDDKCQRMFSSALTKFDNYSDNTNLHIANIGSMRSRLTITKERVEDQLMSFKKLADDNINAELTDTAIDLSNAQLALQAAQLAASKIAQQTLLNYL